MRNLGKVAVGTLVFAVVISLAMSVDVYAGNPSSKVTCKVAEITLIDTTTQQGWAPLLSNTIKTANKKDLFIDVSLECGLYTQTKVDSLGGIEDRAEAEAKVEVRVLVDGAVALPGAVNFAKRSQILVAEFQGLLTDEDGNVCLDVNEFTHQVTIDMNCLRPETLELILDTMNANSFNFVFPDVNVGLSTVEVQARIDTFTESTLDSGAKVDEDFDDTDTTLTIDKEKFDGDNIGDIIVIDDEKLLITNVVGKDLTVVRGYDSTAAAHAKRTRIYIVAGAEAMATIGKGSVTVEEVRLIKYPDIIEIPE